MSGGTVRPVVGGDDWAAVVTLANGAPEPLATSLGLEEHPVTPTMLTTATHAKTIRVRRTPTPTVGRAMNRAEPIPTSVSSDN